MFQVVCLLLYAIPPTTFYFVPRKAASTAFPYSRVKIGIWLDIDKNGKNKFGLKWIYQFLLKIDKVPIVVENR